MEIRDRLIELGDDGYREFTSKLIPGCDTIIGVRMPVLRSLSKEIMKGDWRAFLSEPGPYCHEEKLLMSLVIVNAKMCMDERLAYLERFIPHIDNWAVCDSLTVKRDEGEMLWNFSLRFFDRPGEYEKRFAAIMMMKFIDDEHIDRVLTELVRVKHEGYYLRMGVAWALSFCYITYPEKTLKAMNESDLDRFTFNKTLQKITESLKIDKETKRFIKSLKR